MADTVKKSIESIMAQVNREYEVIIIDDGSSDNSVEIIQELADSHNNLTFVPLSRDSSRRLGETRNISISKASGEWCIFHIDTDDLIGPHIQDFVKIVEGISNRIPHNVLFAGQQIHMAKKTFLVEKGPFKNIYRGEDRDLYLRLVRNSEWIVINHARFIHRINRSKGKLLRKNYRDNLDQVVNDLRSEIKPLDYIRSNLAKISTLSLKLSLFRLVIMPYAIKEARKRGAISRIGYPTHDEFLKYRETNTKSFSEWTIEFGLTEEIKVNRDIFF